MVGGAFFHTRVRTPRMSRSSISKGEPGRVNRAWAWARESAGNFSLKTLRLFCAAMDLRAKYAASER